MSATVWQSSQVYEVQCVGQHPCPACLGHLQDRIDAALAIHAPYSGCLCGQRQAGRPAVCVACSGATGPVPWPCPTARALGAVAP